MPLRLLYPSDPLNPSQPDEAYADEFSAAAAASSTLALPCSLFSFEDFSDGHFKPRPPIAPSDAILYRGWMLTPDGYERLHRAIESRGGIPLTTPAQYRLCHHLPEWYPLCADLTPETIVLPADADFPAALAHTDWPGYFVKDYVKSLSTGCGPVARTPSEIPAIVTLMAKYRGSIEGGLCIRKFEPLEPDSEERYFVLNGVPHARDGIIPPMVQDIARRIPSPFFSVDLARTQTDALRLIELGDGQVSDKKQWPADQFINILRQA